MRKIMAWMACIAILLATLAPAISHAIAPQGGSVPVWSEICTAGGLVAVDAAHLAPDDSSSPEQQNPHFDKCPYCRLQADVPGLPPSAATPTFAIEDGDFHPFLFYQSPSPSFAWTSGYPRAPPVFL